MTRIIEFWRLFEEWVIVFANKFRTDLARKTAITFTAALLLIAIANVVSLAFLMDRVANGTFEEIFSTWGTALVDDVPSPSFTVLEVQERIDELAHHYLYGIAAANVLCIFLLGVITSRVALAPTREAISAQRNFIAHTAHELRTPLSIARANVEVTLMDADTVSKEDCLEELKRVMTELDGLAGIINNLVMLNTLTNLEPAEYHYHNLDEIIAEVAATYREHLAQKAITLTVETDTNLNVWSNRNALKQMVGNIVGNAINFTPQGGAITVRAYRLSERYIRMVITDTGMGIAADELPFIFKPFYRAKAVANRPDGGSGLGLSIVRELVRLHLGRIGIRSVVGEGTSVTIDLPVLKHRAQLAKKRERTETQNSISFDFARGRKEPF